jgi:hypothetical protein
MTVDLWRDHPEPDFTKGDRITVCFNGSKGVYEGTFQDETRAFFGDFVAESSSEIDDYVKAHGGKMCWGK